MQDRLADLGASNPFAASSNSNPFGGSNPFANNTDVNITITEETSKRTPIDLFNDEVESVKGIIEEINDATTRISELNERNTLSMTTEDEHAISSELNKIIEDTNLKATRVKGMLEKMKKDHAALKKDKSSSEAENRIRANLYTVQTRRFMDAMRKYQKIQQTYKADIKKKVKRQVQIVKPDATEDEINMVLRSSDSGSVYKAAILQGTADPIRDAYANCHEKYQDIVRLEQSVAELHQMFLDLALLVDQQGEMLDQIEYQVKSAGEYIESGNEQLSKAINHQSCLRKKKCFLLIFGLILIMIATFAAGVWN